MEITHVIVGALNGEEGVVKKTNRIKAKHFTQVTIQFLCIKPMRQLTSLIKIVIDSTHSNIKIKWQNQYCMYIVAR